MFSGRTASLLALRAGPVRETDSAQIDPVELNDPLDFGMESCRPAFIELPMEILPKVVDKRREKVRLFLI